MTSEEIIESNAKNTIGYAECTNKQSFMIGVSVATHQAQKIYEQRIKELEQCSNMWEREYKRVYADMKGLTTILNRYNSDND